jgi:DNA-binding transcriptional LysR family regulator
MDKLKAMQTFASIADAGSLTAAARSLSSSLPAVVRALAALETQLGVRLFNRTTRSIALTEEGRRYLSSCRQVLAAVEDADNALRSEAAEPSGQLTLTAPVLFGQMYVVPAVVRFLQRYERVRVSVLLLDRVVNLLEDRIDVGVRVESLRDSTLIARSVGRVRRVVVASPDYLRRNGTPRHPKDLLKANCIKFSGGAGPWWTFQDRTKQFTVPVSGNLELNHVPPVIEACAAGLGFGMFVSYQLTPYIARKELVVVLQKFELPPRPINLVYPNARPLPARTKMLIDWLKRELTDFEQQPK